jgi:CRP-like cAMP-binding protein
MKKLPSMLVRKLQATNRLNDDDIAAIERLPIVAHDLEGHESIIREGDKPKQCCLLFDGFACRSKTTDEGKRQILSIQISGDLPDLQSLHLEVMDHDITTLSKCTLGFVSHEAMRDLSHERPRVADALWRDTLVEASVFREWIVNVGRRSASKRMAHLIAELRARLSVVGLSTADTFELPMTQIDLADALGLTPVHVNRVIQELRKNGLIKLSRHTLSLGDAERLMELGDFDESYLHQEAPAAQANGWPEQQSKLSNGPSSPDTSA